MLLKRNVPLPDVAPKTRRAGLSDDIASLAPGESGVVPYSAAAVKQACKRVAIALAETGEAALYAVWPSTSDGTAIETGKEFALVARLTVAQRERFEKERPGSTIAAI